MLNTTTKKSFVLAALMACTGLTSAQAQMLSSGSNNVSVPEMVTKTPVSREGDNLGNHTAEQILDMQGHEITGVVTNGSDESSAVNVGWIFDPDNGVRDNLGNHIAEQILNMRGYKVVNVANAYGGANGDAVNIWTLQRYLSEIPGPDNLGNHIATRDLFLNGHTIRLGPITSTDPNTGLPLAPSGLVISQTMVSGLDLPVNGSDAANKAYVDGLVGSIDMSNVVYTVGDQSINGVKTFVQQIQANGGLNSGNQKIVNLADPTAPQDAVNLRTMETALTNIEQNLVLSQPYTVRPVATGAHSFAAGQNAIVGGSNSVALGTNAVATGNGSVALGFRASSSFLNDVVIGNNARNAGDNGRNVIIGEGSVVNKGSYNIVMGFNAQATSPSTGGGSIVAIGENTTAAGQHAVAMGPGSNASVNRALAIGSIARASGSESVAIGRLSVASAANSAALGFEAQATATNAIALGRLSVANIADTVSVGNDTIKRRILNVGDPSLDTDAVNLRTLRTEISAYSRYSAGDGILFGTPVAGITPINVDTTVVRTVGAQVIGGNKTFTSSVVVDSDANSGFGMRTAAGVIKSTIFSNSDSLRLVRYAPDGTTIGAQLAIMADGRIMPENGRFDGAGQTITRVADPVNPTDAVNLRTLQNAISPGGDNLGNHIATTILNMSNNRVINVAAPINGGDAVNKTYVDNLISGAAYTAGTGITIASNVVAVDSTVVRTTGNQTIGGTKSFTSPIVVTNTFDVNGSAANAQQNGFYIADLGTTVGTTLNPVHTLGIMAQINAARSIGVTVDSSGYLYGFKSHNTAGTYTWQSRTRFADRLTTARTINGVSFDGSANITIPDNNTTYSAGSGLSLSGTTFAVDTTVVRTTGNQDIAGLKTFTNGDIVLESNTNNNMYMRTGAGLNRFLLWAHGTNGNSYLRNYDTDGTTIASELVLTGNGLIFPTTGNLDGNNRVITRVANPVNQTDAVNLRSLNSAYTGGSGINVSSQVVSVDSSVVRTSGDQTISGVKTFNGTVNMNGWDTLRLNAGTATLQVGPNQVRTATDTNFGIYAGNRAGNQRIQMYLEALGTVNIGATSYNSPIMYISIPYQAGITGNSTSGTGQDAGDDGAGTIASISYRDFRIFRRTGITGGLAVYGSRANDVARFDVPMVGYNGLTVTPGTGGEIRFHAPIYAHSYQTFSDERLKDNIETIEADDGLNIIRDLRPAFFTYKEDGRKASGVIAQEIQKTMPWAVLKAKDGMLTVDYTQIIAPLTAAVQNVDARTSELEAQLAAEIQRNDALEARIEKLEALMSQEP